MTTDPALPPLATDDRPERDLAATDADAMLDVEAEPLAPTYGLLVCAKLLALLLDVEDGDAAVFCVLGVVGAVRYVSTPPHVVPCEETRAAICGLVDCWGLLRTYEPRLPADFPLLVVVVVAREAVLRCRLRTECLLRGVLGGLRLGASSSMSLSSSPEKPSSSAIMRTAGSSGCIVRRSSAKRCMSSRKRALEIGRVE